MIPRDVEDVIETVAVCRRHGAPLLSRGGGTSLTGGCCNVAVVMDWSKHLNKVLSIDPAQKLARVQPGTVLDVLRTQAEQHHLTFAPDPSTHTHNTLGGMIGNNSCGVHSLMGLGTGRTSDQVHELDILLYDGTRMTVGATSRGRAGADHPRRRTQGGDLRAGSRTSATGTPTRSAAVTPRTCRAGSPATTSTTCCPRKGFHVARALSGTEGTCVTILEASLHLVHSPAVKSVLVLGYPDVYQRGRPHRGDPAIQADRPGGARRHPRPRHEEEGHPPARHHACCPRGAAGSWSSSAARARKSPTTRPAS